MSLLFGNLTQAFVAFGQAVVEANDDPTAKAQLRIAAARFRHTAANDALYLTCIGKITVEESSNSDNLRAFRYRNICLHIHLYVYLGLHWRSEC